VVSGLAGARVECATFAAGSEGRVQSAARPAGKEFQDHRRLESGAEPATSAAGSESWVQPPTRPTSCTEGRQRQHAEVILHGNLTTRNDLFENGLTGRRSAHETAFFLACFAVRTIS